MPYNLSCLVYILIFPISLSLHFFFSLCTLQSLLLSLHSYFYSFSPTLFCFHVPYDLSCSVYVLIFSSFSLSSFFSFLLCSCCDVHLCTLAYFAGLLFRSPTLTFAQLVISKYVQWLPLAHVLEMRSDLQQFSSFSS